jgi:hypothetical protein
MPQNTNLNISPYFDDFDESKNYKRVLFKPGTPIQARELTTLQSILQNQIEKFGQHFFKEGSVVIPGQVSYDSQYYCVQIDETHLGIPVSLYIENFVGKLIRGETSGVTAKIENFITSTESERKNYTLYLKYQSSSNVNFTTNSFLDGENLISVDDVLYGISSIRAGTTFATSIVANSTATGSAVKIAEGVYFIRGFFVTVPAQTVILDQYSNSPSYRVGLLINEELAVASNQYDDLFDNAQGFSNFAAPGADRLKYELTLIKKELDDFNDEDFIELIRLEGGTLQKFVKTSNYDLIRDELARRTYDESGDYYVRPFNISLKESLNDRTGNNGIFVNTQKTRQGNIPSDNKGCIVVGPGKAYVRGYDIETIDNVVVDFDKPRTTETAVNKSIPFSIGRQIVVNNVYGSSFVGFGSTSQVSLYSNRTATPGLSSGNKIGVARVYDFKLKNAGYADSTTQFECSLYDIQTYTTIKLNTSITLSAPAFIQGQNSFASGYLTESITNSDVITLYQVSGSFKKNERIAINGVDNGRIVSEVRDYSLSDVHQIRSSSGINTFTADPVLSNRILLSEPGTQYTITVGSAGVSTVTTSDINFYVGISTGDIVSYTKGGLTVPTYNRVSSIDSVNKKITVSAVSSVVGVCDGTLPTSTITASDFRKATLQVSNTSNAYLYAKLYNKNIANLDLNSSDIIVKKSYNIVVASNTYTGTLETDINLTLEPFDEEDYTLSYISNGVVEPLTDQKVAVNGRTINLNNLSSNGNAVLTVTYKKINTKVKRKIFNRASSLIISGSSSVSSGVGKTTLDDGLTYRSAYGLRVQDKVVSLNIPDVISILGVYESSTTNNPTLPQIYFESLNSSVNNLIKGEQLVGEASGAVAVFVSSTGVNSIEICYLNENRFSLGERVTSQETSISGVVNSFTIGDKNIKDNFTLDDGQRSEYYDYSRLIRKSEVSSPTKKIRVIYNHYTIDTSDGGDFVGADSYSNDRYSKDIGIIDGLRNTDIIDLRPRVDDFSPINATTSPFEYNSRIFTVSSNSATNIFSKDKSLNLSYSYYLPRIDKLFLSKEGTLILTTGVPSLSPKAPNALDSALEIATIYYPPYLYNIKDAKVSLASHKRYKMKDISRLEDRLANVEYYTSLSLLESDTKNLSLRDPQTGLDKFKCGFFVDNFKSYSGGDIANRIYRSSVDTALGQLKPQHYTTSLDLLLGSDGIIGIGTTSNPNSDLRWAEDLGSDSITRVGDLICLKYNDIVFTQNRFATRSENVNPFNTPSWIGSIELNPSTDTWIETRRSERTEDIEGSYTTAMQQLGVDSNTGLSPINWNAWETNWTGTSTIQGPLIIQFQGETTFVSDRTVGDGFGGTIRTQVFQDNFTDFRRDTFTTNTNQSRQGIQFGVTERFDTTSLGDRVVSRAIVTLMRSRNIEVVAKRLKPSTKFYAFFDNVSVTEFIVPKLLEVRMVSGTFLAGETVTGIIPITGSNKSIRFRLAKQNHKYGPYNPPGNPVDVYKENPYNPSNALASSYSSTTTVLNIDTASLELQADSNFFGSVAPNMQLVGETSRAVAAVTDIRLISDSSGTFIGSLFIPDPTIPSNPSFETGTKTLTLTTSPTNSNIASASDSLAEANFNASGSIDNVENVTLRIRNAEIERNIRSESRTLTETEERVVASTSSRNRSIITRTPQRRFVDPLAQSFEVTESNGVFITKCEIYFRSKDPTNIPITLQIRPTELGLPTQEILPFSEVVLDPGAINVSEDASVPTTFKFPSPVFLEGAGNQYAIVLISNSDSYNVWISRMTEVDVSTQNKPESERIIVSQQPTLGSLFKSQNGATWDPSQLEDLKFTLYRAEFASTTGSIKFYNPELGIGNRQVASLRSNPVVAYSNKILVGLAQSITQFDINNLSPGTTLYQTNYPEFSGNLLSIVGSVGIGSTLSVTNPGSAYTTNATYSNVPVTTLSGRGFGAKVNLTIQNNVAVAATVSIGGTGYAIGDTLTVSKEFTGNFGKNLILSIPNITGIITAYNSLIIDNVQDVINTSGVLNEIVYVNSSGGISTITNGFVTYSETISDGLHLKVNHNNHGMYSDLNSVILYNIESDLPPGNLLVDYNQSSTSAIQVSTVGIFTSFENLGISSDNPGYVKINNEIIKYTGINTAANTLTGITRGIDSTDSVFTINYHPTGSPVFKYEFNGVSLRRINRNHSFSDVDLNNYPIGIDSYHVKILMDEKGKDRKSGTPRLFFKESKTGGTYDLNISSSGTNTLSGPKATQNIPFNLIRPNIQIMAPETTNVDASVKTISGSSVDGNESSFVESGFVPISLNSNNYFTSPRLIASRVNELNNLSNSLGSKSFVMELKLSTKDTKVSPMIDLDRINIITSMNRINNPVQDFKNDSKVNSLYDDPNAAIYVSKIIRLEKNADSLKVYFDAFKDSSNEIIVMYRILRSDTPDEQQLYELFPGYGNLDDFGNTIDPKENNGLSDKFVPSSSSLNDLRSYEYTAKNLPLFNGYQIKIIMTGTNQAITPTIKDLRAIATI